MKMKFTVLGTRGSVPVEGKDYSIYGGATSCYQVRAGNEEIYLDAGSGIVTAKISANTNISILFSHMHMDHVLGLPFFSALSQKDRSVDMYSEKSSGLDLKSAIDHLIAPPFWPVKIEQYPANVRFHDVQKKFSIGEVEIETMSGNHPGGTTIYRLNYKSKSIVYVTDFEHSSEEKCEELIRFSADCDLLTYDAQYTNEEYNRFRGFGHMVNQMRDNGLSPNTIRSYLRSMSCFFWELPCPRRLSAQAALNRFWITSLQSCKNFITRCV